MNCGENALELAVLITLDNGGTGSAFRLSAGGKLFIITAKHVLYGDNQKLKAKTAEVSSSTKTNSTNKNHRLRLDFEKTKPLRHKEADIVAIHIGDVTRTSPSMNGVRFLDEVEVLNLGDGDLIAAHYLETQLLDEIVISNDVYLVGYPTSLGLKMSPQFDYNQPLLRKGIVANTYKEKGTIILDCPAYYGNSGGPVILVNENKKPIVMGVTSRFVPFVQEWVNKREQHLVHQEYLNSGYSTAVCMDKVFELIGFDPGTPLNPKAKKTKKSRK